MDGNNDMTSPLHYNNSSWKELELLSKKEELYAIWDAAVEPEIVDKVEELHESQVVSLFRKSGVFEQQPYVPYLVSLDIASLRWSQMFLGTESWGLFLQGPKRSLEMLQHHLRQMLYIRDPYQSLYYFRYYHSHVLEAFLATCQAHELAQWYGPIQAFGWPQPDDDSITWLQPSFELPTYQWKPSKEEEPKVSSQPVPTDSWDEPLFPERSQPPPVAPAPSPHWPELPSSAPAAQGASYSRSSGQPWSPTTSPQRSFVQDTLFGQDDLFGPSSSSQRPSSSAEIKTSSASADAHDLFGSSPSRPSTPPPVTSVTPSTGNVAPSDTSSLFGGSVPVEKRVEPEVPSPQQPVAAKPITPFLEPERVGQMDQKVQASAPTEAATSSFQAKESQRDEIPSSLDDDDIEIW